MAGPKERRSASVGQGDPWESCPNGVAGQPPERAEPLLELNQTRLRKLLWAVFARLPAHTLPRRSALALLTVNL